jgi:phosphoribosylamine--glycine ligase
MPKRVLIIGSGGREHAIAWALANQSDELLELYCAPGNAGIAELATCIPTSVTDVKALAELAMHHRIDLTIPGGEASLAAGVVDHFNGMGLLIAGPTSAATRLESSKVFAKEFMSRNSIPTSRFRTARTYMEAESILLSGEFGGADSPVVVKADGLSAGKGVIVAADRAEALGAARTLLEQKFKVGGTPPSVVIEERLEGVEASVLLFADGQNFVVMPPARDHKRIGEGDTGPNTGGMGAVTAPDILDRRTLEFIEEHVIRATLEAARREGFSFQGILFLGLMLTDSGPKVLEYNVRFGDPETQAILVRLQGGLWPALEAVAKGTLSTVDVKWSNNSSACVVVAAEGYPAEPKLGGLISGIENAVMNSTVQVFHAGTTHSENGDLTVAGGRVLGVTATGTELDEALSKCYSAIDKISFPGMQFRRDIGRFC